MIFVLEDDEIMAECIAKATKKPCRIFPNAIAAMNAISDGEIPDLIFLDVLLDGPDGFTFLNELASYSDTSKIPIIITTSLDLKTDQLQNYQIEKILKKDEMTPEEIKKYADQYAK